MKRLTKILSLTFALVLCFASCDSDDKQTTNATAPSSTTVSGDATSVPDDTSSATDNTTNTPTDTAPATDAATNAPATDGVTNAPVDTAPHTHAFGDWAVTKNATCTEDGEKTRTCTCGEIESETIPAAHTEKVISGKAATCTEAGLTDGKKCTVCNAVLVKQTEIAAKGHIYSNGVCKGCGKAELKASQGLSYSLNDDGKSYSVVDIGTCTDKDIVILSTYNGKPVTNIDYWAFMGAEITSVTIADGITTIEDEVFAFCYSLKSVTLPNTITNIKYMTFGECVALTSIIIPDGVKSIGHYCFTACESLKNITLPSSTETVGERAFWNCSALSSITFKGTKAQWNAIEKGEDWDADTGNYTVHCTDGDIAK